MQCSLTCDVDDADLAKKFLKFLKKLLQPLLGKWAGNVNVTVDWLVKLVHIAFHSTVMSKLYGRG